MGIERLLLPIGAGSARYCPGTTKVEGGHTKRVDSHGPLDWPLKDQSAAGPLGTRQAAGTDT